MTTKPYELPADKVLISFSGGRTSGYMLHHILEANDGIADRAVVVFSNTGREMPQTLDFVQECSHRWGVPIVWVEDAKRGGERLFEVVGHNTASRHGEPFERLIARRKACPDISKRFCTSELKVLPTRRFLMSLGWRAWWNALGIRADEAHRAKPSDDKRVTRWFPLVAANVTKRDVKAWWAKQPFDLGVPDGYGNCDGCFLKSEATLSALARDYPERHDWWERMEARATELGRGRRPVRFRKEYSRAELRRFVEKQGDWIFEKKGVLCQADAGECTE